MFAVVRPCAAAAFAAAAVGRLDVPRGLNNNTQNNNRNHCLFLEHSHQLTILHPTLNHPRKMRGKNERCLHYVVKGPFRSTVP